MLENGFFAESATGQERNQTWSIETPGVARDPWLENAPCARLVRDAGMSTRPSAVHPPKAEPPIVVRLEQPERSTAVKDLHPEKAEDPIVVRLGQTERSMAWSRGQSLNALFPIEVI